MERRRPIRDAATGEIVEVIVESIASLKDDLTGAEIAERDFDFFVCYGPEEDKTALEPFRQAKPAIAAAHELQARGVENVRINGWPKGITKINRGKTLPSAVAELALRTPNGEPEPHRIGFQGRPGPKA